MQDMSLLLPLLQNAAMLLAMVVIHAIGVRFFRVKEAGRQEPALLQQALTGLLMGITGIIIILTPVNYVDEIIFDTRSVLISLTGLFFGGLPVIITMAMTAAFRFWLGGLAALTGILVILSSGLLGLIWRQHCRERLATLGIPELFAFGLLVHVVMFFCMLTLPGGIALAVISDIMLPILLVYPLATVLLGKLLSYFLRGELLARKILRDEQRLRLALSGSGQDMFELNLQNGKLETISREESARKYPNRNYQENIQSLLEDLHPDDAPRIEELFRQISAGTLDNWSGEFRERTLDGGWAWIQVSGQLASRDFQGKPLSMLGTFIDITARKQDEEKLRVFRELIDNASDAIEVLDPASGRFLDVNNNGSRELGYSREELLNMTVFDVDPMLKPENFFRSMDNLAEKPSFIWMSEHRRKDGSLYPIEVNLKFVRLERDYLVAAVRNISERKQTEEALHMAAQVYQSSSEAMMVTDHERRIIDVNPMFTQVTGYSREEIIGQTPRLLHSGLQSEEFYRTMWAVLQKDGHWSGEIWNRRKNGEIYPEWMSINAIRDAEGKPYRWIAQFTDISDKKHAEEQIWRQANIDAITGLPNRSMFLDRLRLETSRGRRAGTRLALLFLDLDRFKEVNDSLGHDVGDMLLQEAAIRLRSSVRESDTVARLGGDEFIIILNDLKDMKVVGGIADKVRASMSEVFELNSNQVYIGASIGITIYPDDGESTEVLLKNADQAMYKAKREGRNRYFYFTPSMQAEVNQRSYLLSELRLALSRNQLQVHFQPIVEMSDGRIVKIEALVRWKHQELGWISPASFIPIAEESGLVVPLGNMVLHESLDVLQKLQGICPVLQLSVNKSPAQFGNNEDNWIEAIQNSRVASNQLVVEITEGLLLDERPAVQEHLQDLIDAGIKVAIDDFGTGYSSLAYLKKFQIAFLKIDQSFVRNLAAGNEDHALCEAMITMAHKLGIKVIAEGVETQLQYSLLKDAGCDFAQGYYFAKPMSFDDLKLLLETTLQVDGHCRCAPLAN